MIEERDFTWTPEVEPDLVLDNVRDAIYGHIPAYVVTAEGKRAKAPDIGKIKDELARALSDSDGSNMTGYSIVYNQWTQIHDQDGKYLERIAPGAAARAVKDRGDRILVMYDHGRHPYIGQAPIAAPRALWEDERGLFGWDRLHDAPSFDLVRANLRAGTIKGQSFRFSVFDGGDTWEAPKRDGLRRRTLTAVDIIERGPVNFPAYPGTDVALRSEAALRSDVGHILAATPIEIRRAMRLVLAEMDDDEVDNERAIIVSEGTGESAAHEGTDGLAAERQGQVPGITRQQMSDRARVALALHGENHVKDRGAA